MRLKNYLSIFFALAILIDFTAYGKEPKSITNLGKVSDHLYRGARLRSEANYKQLADLGVNTILSLEKILSEDEKMCNKYHFNCVRYPLILLALPDADRFFDYEVLKEAFRFLIQEIENNWVVFAHCYYGKDRTGTLVALYEIRESACGKKDYDPDALWAKVETDLDQYGFHNDLYPKLKSNIRAWVYQVPDWVCAPTNNR